MNGLHGINQRLRKQNNTLKRKRHKDFEDGIEYVYKMDIWERIRFLLTGEAVKSHKRTQFHWKFKLRLVFKLLIQTWEGRKI